MKSFRDYLVTESNDSDKAYQLTMKIIKDMRQEAGLEKNDDDMIEVYTPDDDEFHENYSGVRGNKNNAILLIMVQGVGKYYSNIRELNKKEIGKYFSV